MMMIMMKMMMSKMLLLMDAKVKNDGGELIMLGRGGKLIMYQDWLYFTNGRD